MLPAMEAVHRQGEAFSAGFVGGKPLVNCAFALPKLFRTRNSAGCKEPEDVAASPLVKMKEMDYEKGVKFF